MIDAWRSIACALLASAVAAQLDADELVWVGDLKTWDAALAHCEGLGDGAGFPSVHSGAGGDETVLRNFVADNPAPQGSFWVGYRSFGRTATGEIITTWSDGSPFDFVNWGAGDPSAAADQCGAWNRLGSSPTASGDWWDVACSGGRPFVCHVPSAAPTPAPGPNPPYQCNGRDPECVFSEELDNWVCSYEMHIRQHMAMRVEGDSPLVDNTNFIVAPVQRSYPIKIDNTGGGDFAELSFRDCTPRQFFDEVKDYGLACDDADTPIDATYYGGADEDPIILDGVKRSYVSFFDDPKDYGLACDDADTPIDATYHGGADEDPIILDGVKRRVSAINGQIPAPTLCVGWNDIVRAHVINDMEGGYEVTAMHWHGMFQRGSFWMDGPSHINQCSILPHGEYTYEFVADPPGTHWYHAHSGVQIADGLFGNLIVLHDPVTERLLYEDLYDVDEPDEVMLLGDWEHENYQEVMAMHPGNWVDDDGNYVPNPISPEDGQWVSGTPYVSGLINGHGEFNGNRLRPYTFNVRDNSRIRFRVTSAAAMFPFRVSVDDHELTLIAADGLDIQPEVVDGFIIYPAERYDFVLETGDLNGVTDYWVRAEALDGESEILAIVHYDATPDTPALASRPTTQSVFQTKCASEECRVAFCPWPEEYSTNANIKCFDHAEMRRERAQNAVRNHAAQLPNVQEAIDNGNIIYLNFNILGDNSNTRLPNVDGIFGTLPLTPPFLRDGEVLRRCNLPEDYGEFGRCVHAYDLNFNETYLFVFSNRWPLLADLTLGQNFPGVQTHPVHMHGHSFYLLAESTGTLNTQGITNGGNGCQSGTGNTSFNAYCFDEETLDENFVCNEYWGDCSFTGELPDLIPIEEAVQKDTIPVPARGYVVLAIVADNPGWWFMHCHIDVHVAEGMNVILSEAPDQTRTLVDENLPENYPSCGSFILPDQ